MVIIDVAGAIVIAVLAVAAIVMFVAVVAAAVVVTGAVHIEERRKTLAGPAPGFITWIARRVLGAPAPRGHNAIRAAGPGGRVRAAGPDATQRRGVFADDRGAAAAESRASRLAQRSRAA